MTRIKNIIKNMNLVSVYDIDALTYHELIYAIGDVLLKNIKSLTEVGVYVDEKITEMERTLDELLNNRLADEVFKQMLVWKDDGTFDVLITNSFNELKPVVDDLQNDLNVLNRVMTENVENLKADMNEKFEKSENDSNYCTNIEVKEVFDSIAKSTYWLCKVPIQQNGERCILKQA